MEMKRQRIGLFFMVSSLGGTLLNPELPSTVGVLLVMLGWGPCILVFPSPCLLMQVLGMSLIFLGRLTLNGALVLPLL